jgi:hypothetical protein
MGSSPQIGPIAEPVRAMADADGRRSVAQQFSEDDRVVVLAVASGVEDGQPAACRVPAQLVEAAAWAVSSSR